MGERKMGRREKWAFCMTVLAILTAGLGGLVALFARDGLWYEMTVAITLASVSGAVLLGVVGWAIKMTVSAWDREVEKRKDAKTISTGFANLLAKHATELRQLRTDLTVNEDWLARTRIRTEALEKKTESTKSTKARKAK